MTVSKHILDDCEIYYKENLIPSDVLLNIMKSDGRGTGTVDSVGCEVLSVLIAALSCLENNETTNDDVIARLKSGDMVIFRDERYRWLGVEEFNGSPYLALEQDGYGKNGPVKNLYPYENRYCLFPYYGKSKKTGRSGVRKTNPGREQFLSLLLDLPLTEVPVEINTSSVIIADRKKFTDIYKNLYIKYGDNSFIGLQDVVPASYFSANGTEYCLGSNQTKVEPMLKVTSSISRAESLLLDKGGNRMIGLFIFESGLPIYNASHLKDSLTKESFKCKIFISSIHSVLCPSYLYSLNISSF